MRNLCACGRAIVAGMIACVAPGARPDRDTEAQRFPCPRRIGPPEGSYIILQLAGDLLRGSAGAVDSPWAPARARGGVYMRNTRCAARSRHRGAEVSFRSEDFRV